MSVLLYYSKDIGMEISFKMIKKQNDYHKNYCTQIAQYLHKQFPDEIIYMKLTLTQHHLT